MVQFEPLTEEQAKKAGWPCEMCEYGDATTEELVVRHCGECLAFKPYVKPSKWKLKERSHNG